jgi:4-amino-4-deoxy-L-arabinose transferase-like glycosyltransferase
MPLAAGRLRPLQPYLLLGLLCLCLYVPGIAAIPPLDRDESRFAQATRQMLESGDFLQIRFQDQPRNKKPAGIYWLQAASVGAFSSPAATAIWPYRLPSLLGATAAVLLAFGLGAGLLAGRTAGRRTAGIAAVLLASAFGVVAEAHIAKADAVLLAAVTAGQGALGLAYVRARSGRNVPGWIAVLFWVAEFAAIMLKGPPGPLLAVITAAALSLADGDARWLRGLRPLAGLIALGLALAPWLIAIERATEGRFLAESLGHDLALKLIGAQEAHGAPPFSYLLFSVANFWPGSLLLVPAIVGGWRRHEAPAERFLLAWLVPAWVLLELVPTKLPHYALPLFPALALLAAMALAERGEVRPARWERRADFVVTVLWALVALGLAVLLIGLPLRFADHVVAGGIVGAVVVLALAAALLYFRPGPTGATALAAALSLAFVVPASISVLPGLERLWLSREAAALVARHADGVRRPLVTVGYSEPSLVFLLGTDLRLATPRDAAETLAGGGGALVSGREDAMFHQALNARGLAARAVGSVRGLDYSNGQRMVVTLYGVAPR